ncbi:MAG TPA: hypothetical protein DEB18_00470, partial [Leeuwenhoekiella sp.]|nr:hypothetical protein [Leeuwenhoekiella sp.]
QLELANSIAKDLGSSQWHSTQTTAYALLSLSKMLIANGGKAITVQLDGTALTTENGFLRKTLNVSEEQKVLTLKNTQDNRVYVSLIQQGKLPLGEELASQNNLILNTQFLDGNGKNIAVNNLRKATAIKAKITVTNNSQNQIDNVALSQIFPSGWEIVNTSYTSLNGGASGTARYKDIRDDRVNFYFDLKPKTTRTFEVDLNTSFLGTYYLPGTQVEAMYDHTYFARTKGQWITVEQ